VFIPGDIKIARHGVPTAARAPGLGGVALPPPATFVSSFCRRAGGRSFSAVAAVEASDRGWAGRLEANASQANDQGTPSAAAP